MIVVEMEAGDVCQNEYGMFIWGTRSALRWKGGKRVSVSECMIVSIPAGKVQYVQEAQTRNLRVRIQYREGFYTKQVEWVEIIKPKSEAVSGE